MTDKLNIANEMARFDQKDRDFYDSLDEQERKKFSPYLMIRWGASVQGDADLQAYYLMSTNEHLNKNFFDISAKEHKKFQWLMATTVSPGLGKQYHKWLAAGKKDSANNKTEKFLSGLYPHLKHDEIRLMAQLNTKSDLKELARAHGLDDRQIKESL
jgi:hypothetical protein